MQEILWKLRSVISYYWNANTIYQVHSPLAYQVIRLILDHEKRYYAFKEISELRNSALRDDSVLERTDFGAGQQLNTKTTIRSFTSRATIQPQRGESYFRLMQWKKPGHILELGTASGFSAAYLASGATSAKLTTLEGDPALVDYAQELFSRLDLKNITIHSGRIEETLAAVASGIAPIDVVHLDANHSYAATIQYFKTIQPHLAPGAWILVDDIRWSRGMYRAWKDLTNGLDPSIAIEFFGWGLLILDAPVPVSQHLICIDTHWKPWTVVYSL